MCAGVRCVPSLGDEERPDPGPQRQQVRRDVRVQRVHHVRAGGRHQLRTERGPERFLHHHLSLHHILHYRHTVSSLRAKGSRYR